MLIERGATAEMRLRISGGTTEMDQITKSLLKNFVAERDLGSLDESKQFEHFCAYSVMRREFYGSFDTADLVVGQGDSEKKSESEDESKKTEAGGDTGIDAIGVIVNGNLVTDLDELTELESASYWQVTFALVQAETSSSFDTAKLAKFANGVIDFFSNDPKFPRNAAVAGFANVRRRIYDMSPKFSKGNPACKIYYITTGKLKEEGDAHMQAHSGLMKETLDDTGLFSSVEFIPLGSDGIQRLYHRTKSAAEASFNFFNRVTISKIAGIQQAYSGFLTWGEYKKIITTESGGLNTGLFFDNIRDWQGFNDVNTEIKDTLASQDKVRFVLMNNGVTIIARELRPTGDSFTIEDYQIVNGCQTTNVLFDQRASLDESVTIPVRIISTKDEEIIKSITKATNRQTRVKPEQLFALQEYPKALEAYFASFEGQKRLYFERRDRQYDIKAGGESNSDIKQVRIISFSDMIRAFAAMFLNEPHRTTRNFGGLKAKVGTHIYAKDQRMDLYYTAAFAIYKTRFFIRSERIKREFSPAAFHIILALRILIAGYEHPTLKAKAADKYCKKILDVLYDAARCDEFMLKAAALVEASGGGLNRDEIRTEPYTERVIAAAKKATATGVK